MSAEGSISYVVPKDALITQPFAFCASFKENSVDGNSFFTLYGTDGNPLLGFSVWPAGPEEKLGRWVRIRSVWRKVGDVEMYGLNFWTHVCFILDTKFRDVKISINGEEPISITDEEIMIEAPNDLKNGLKTVSYTHLTLPTILLV